MIIGIQAALTKLKAFVDSFTRADDGADPDHVEVMLNFLIAN